VDIAGTLLSPIAATIALGSDFTGRQLIHCGWQQRYDPLNQLTVAVLEMFASIFSAAGGKSKDFYRWNWSRDRQQFRRGRNNIS